MGRGGDGRDCVRGAALAQPGAGAIDAGGRDCHGVAVCEGAEYFALSGGTGNSGSVGGVGISAGVASLDESGAGVLELSLESCQWSVSSFQ